MEETIIEVEKATENSIKNAIEKKNKVARYYAAIVFILSFIVYLATLSPTVGWGDSGEFITATYTLGVLHPTGYPLYTMLGHLFTYLPIGSIAYRVNFMSAVFASLAVLILYFISLKLIRSPRIALATALIFAFSYAFWSQAVIAEVHTLSMLLLAITFFLVLKWKESNNLRYLYGASFTYGLSLSNHLTTALLAPAILAFVFLRDWEYPLKFKIRKDLLTIKTIVIIVVLFTLGLTPYLYIPIISSTHPIWNWGEVSSFKELFLHAIGAEYTLSGNFITSEYIIYNLSNFVSGFVREGTLLLEILYFALIAIGIRLSVKSKDPPERVLSLVVLITAGIGILFALNYNTDSGAFLLPTFFMGALIIGITLRKIAELIPSKYSRYQLAFFSIAFVLPLLAVNYEHNNLSQDYSAEEYWRNIFETTEKNSIIFGIGTSDMFIPLFFQHVLGEYTDRRVFNQYFLTKPWGSTYYAQNWKVILPVEKLRQSYNDSKEIMMIIEKNVDKIIRTYGARKAIYSTTADVPRNASKNLFMVPYGFLYQFKESNASLQAPRLPYPFSKNVESNDGMIAMERALIIYGLSEFAKGNSSAAQEYLRGATEVNPKSFGAWNDLAIILFQEGDYEGALDAWETAVSIKKDPTIRKNIQILKQMIKKGNTKIPTKETSNES